MFSEIWSRKKCSFLGSCKISDDEEGLRILTKIATGNSNVVIKPILLPNKISNFRKNPSASSDDHHHSYCYLKSCHLCHKPLTLDKEIYMYRGDLGFCSVACRERQIYLDETKEMEISTQRILSSFRRDATGRCETNELVKEFRRRRHPFTPSENRVVFS